MAKDKQNVSLERRTFCAGTLGLSVLGPLGLLGCGSGSDTGSASGEHSTKLLADETVSPATFVHPGLLHTQADFDRMRQKVAANASPWIDSWNKLIVSKRTALSWTPNPSWYVSLGPDNNYPNNAVPFMEDVAAAYECAIRWNVSGETAYADKAIQIMNAWSSTLTTIGGVSGNPGNDGYLLAGIQGYQFANAAEIMRNYSGWAASDFKRFQDLMLNVFYPINHRFFSIWGNKVWSNWELCCLASIIAIGVLCDNQSLFDEAVDYFKNGSGAGCVERMAYYVHPGYLAQTQESGRDQGHSLLAVGLLTDICEMAWNQGLDLYGYQNNRALAAVEYVAKSNLIQSGTTYYTMPFVPYADLTALSTILQGQRRLVWSRPYHHYVNRMGLAAPYCKRFVELTQPEGGCNVDPNSPGYEQVGYGSLLYTRDPIASGAAPSGLTAILSNRQVILSWWGTAYATSYNVKRGTVSGGPYTTIATGISDLLTYTDSTPGPETYYYVVTAVTPIGETATSNEATASTGLRLHTLLTFDEGSGTNAADATGNGHTGTLVNGVSWAAGRKGNAVVLNGTDGYVSLPAGLLANLGDCTIAAWVYWNGGQTWSRIFDFGKDTSFNMFLTPAAYGAGMRFVITTIGQPGEQRINSAAALPSKQWVHIAVSLAGSVGTLYVNGSAVGTNTAMSFLPFRLANTTNNWIGRSQYSGDAYFNGIIDDFRIYNGAMNDDDLMGLIDVVA